MAQAKGKVGSLFFGMTLDTNDFKKKLKETRKKLSESGKAMRLSFIKVGKAAAAMSVAAAAAATGLLVFAKNTAAATNEQLLLADSIGATQSEIAGLELAAQKFGVETSMMIDKMREFGGVDAFMEYADQVKNAGDEQAQLNKTLEIFGAEGAKMLPLLQQGAAGLRAMEQEAFALGLALSPQQINESRVAWEAYEETLLSFKGLGKQIGAALLEPFGLASAGLGSFIKTFKDDIIGAFSFIADTITSFIKGAFDLFAEFGIPMINSMLEFASALGETFSTVFDFISDKGSSTFSFIGNFFKGFLEFLATFKQTFIAGVTGAVATVLEFSFNSLSKFSDFIGNLATDIAFLGEELGLVEEGFGQAVSDSFVEQGVKLRQMGKDLAKPFKIAQDDAIDEAAKILERLSDKNEKDQKAFLSGIEAFIIKFGETVSSAGESAKNVADEIKKVQGALDPTKKTGAIIAGSQEEARILNAQSEKNLDIQKQQLKEQKKLNRNFQGIGVMV